MKEKEYKEEIIRLENVLLEKEKTIQDLQDKINVLYLQKNKKYNLINIQKEYFKNPKNVAIYDALIQIMKFHIYNTKETGFDIKEIEKRNNNLTKIVKKLEKERDFNND